MSAMTPDHRNASWWRSLLPALAVVFLFRIVLLCLAPAGPFHEFIEPESDERAYVGLASRLADSGFTEYRIAGDSADQRRTPVVPFLMAVEMGLLGIGWLFQIAWVVGQQLSLVAALGLAADALRVLGVRVSGVALAALAAFDLVSFTLGGRFLTEPTYALLLAAAVRVLAAAIAGGERGLTGRLAACGLLLGIAALARPIGLALVAPIAVLVAIRHRRLGRTLAVPMLALVCGWAVPVGAWAARNGVVHGRPFVSEIGKVGLYFYWAAGVEAGLEGRPFQEVHNEHKEKFAKAIAADPTNALLRQDFLSREAWRILRAHPFRAVAFLPRGMYYLFGGRATAELNELCGQPNVGLVEHVRSPRSVPFASLLILELAALLATAGLFVWRAGQGLRSPARRWGVVVALAPIAFHAALSWGPEATSRFRVPMMPWVIAVAAARKEDKG